MPVCRPSSVREGWLLAAMSGLLIVRSPAHLVAIVAKVWFAAGRVTTGPGLEKLAALLRKTAARY
jgi:hypothetical protein